MTITPELVTSATPEEVAEHGFVGSVVQVLPPESYTVEGVTQGPAVTDPEYAAQRYAEANPPDPDALLADQGSTGQTASKSKSTSSESKSS